MPPKRRSACHRAAPVSPLRWRGSLLRPYDKNRTRRVPHDTLGDATKQSALYSPAPVAADHDEVRSHSMAALTISVAEAPDGKELQRGRLWRQTLTEIADQLFRFLFRQ